MYVYKYIQNLRYNDWVTATPAISRFFMQGFVFVYILSYIVDVGYYTANCPVFVLFNFVRYVVATINAGHLS